MQVVEGRLDDPRVVALLRAHIERAVAETGRGSAHALDVDALRAPQIAFWSVWEGDAVLGVAALKRLDGHGEIKSMYVAQTARGRGVASALLAGILDHAQAAGLERLSLETGAWPYFAPARALYARHGFAVCPPFGDYGEDPNSVFMTRTLGATVSPSDRR